MADIAKQIEQARIAGYSDAEISDFVSRNNALLAPKIKEASAAGYQPSEILGHLAATPKPTPKPYDIRRGAKMKGETDPNALGNGFMGTLATDMANAPESAFNLIRHPIDSAVAIGKTALSLPGDLYQDVSQGNWGKLGARALEFGIGGGTKPIRAAGTAVKDAAEGAAESLKTAPVSSTGKAIGRAGGTALGYKVLGYPGALAGGEIGATVGGKYASMGDAIQAGINRVKLRAQQRNNPAPTGETFGPSRVPPVADRTAPAWQDIPDRVPGGDNTVEVAPVPATKTPSGRVPGTGQPAPKKTPIPTRQTPAWRSLPDRAPGGEPPVDVTPVPATQLPSGRVPGKPIKRASAIEPPAQSVDTAAEAPAASSPPFEGNAAVRETTARNISMAKAMHQASMTPEMAGLMEGSHWKQLAEGMGLKVPNAESVKSIVAELKRLHDETPAVASNPKAYANAVGLRDAMEESGTIPKPSPRGKIKPPK